MNRTILAVLTAAAMLSLAASGGGAPWRYGRVYAWEIMTKQERLAFREEMRTYAAYDDQLAFWRRHIVRMKERAWNSGVFLDEPPEIMPAGQKGYRQLIFADHLMTGEEIEAYRAKERSLRTEEEHEAFRREHEIAMKAKAWAKGLPIEPTPAERKRERELREAAEKKTAENGRN